MSKKPIFKIILLGADDGRKSEVFDALFPPAPDSTEDAKYGGSGVRFAVKNVQVNPELEVVLQLWEIDPSDQNKILRSTYYHGAKGAILVFNFARPRTWDATREWLADIQASDPSIPYLCIGISPAPDEGIEDATVREAAQATVEADGGLFFEVDLQNNSNLWDVLSEFFKQIPIPLGMGEPQESTETGILEVSEVIVRRHCPQCGNANPNLIKEIVNKAKVINLYPLIYGKKNRCGQCGLEWE